MLLGYPTPADYLHQAAYLGATVGRYANRIANAQITLDGETIQLVPNQGPNQLHGGPEGFHAQRWQKVTQDDHQVTYKLDSPDGDQGFPGNLTVEVQYLLTEDNRLEIHYQAQVDKTCPVNLTNHAYFNLDGEGHDARSHRLQLFADRYLPVDSAGIPTEDSLMSRIPVWIFANLKHWRRIFYKIAASNELKAMTTLICCTAPVGP